jgi:LPS export ABC transporter protein LptC
MTRIKNLIFVLLLTFLFVEVLVIFPSYLEDIESDPIPAPTAKQANSAEQKMEGVHLVESRQGARDWELFSERAEAFESKNMWELLKVKVQFYNQDHIDFTVNGNEGNIDTKSKNMKIAGKVILASANGYRFETDQVLYQSETREIVSPGPIRMTAPKDEHGEEMILRGSEMVVHVDQSKMIVKNDVKASKKLSTGKKLELISDAAELSGRGKEVQFQGHVVINYAGSKIEAPVAAFTYAPDKSKLQNIIFNGGVRVSDQDKYALSDEMNLDVLTNKFTFTGQPRVYQNNDELTGDKIIFLDGGKRVKVEKIKARVENKGK